MSTLEETKAKIAESQARAEDAKRRIAEKVALQKANAELDERLHLERFYEAKEKAIETYGENRLVEVHVPSVGMTLHRFAHIADHTPFTKSLHVAVEISSCRTFTAKTVLFPDAATFSALVSERNPEGFVKCALAVKTAMRGVVEEEGKD